MTIARTDKLHIWPQMAGEPTDPLTGYFAVCLGKGRPERALSVVSLDGNWFVYLDGHQVAPQSPDWRTAFGNLYADRPMLLGRRLTSAEHERLRRQRLNDAEHGLNLNQPINLNRVKAPF